MVINNISDNAKAYIVARTIDGELWYWGSWDDEYSAKKACRAIQGVMIYKGVIIGSYEG